MTDPKCLSFEIGFLGPYKILKRRTSSKLAKIAKQRRVASGEKLLNEKPPDTTCFIIHSGIAKIIASHADGENQLVGLKFPSEFVGYPFSTSPLLYAEAATDMEICSFQRSAFECLMEKNPDLEHAILQCTLHELEAAQDWIHMISRKTAEERIASLLLLMVRKMRPNVISKKLQQKFIKIEMPINRAEVSECLGLRLETVSRQMTEFKSDGILATGPHRSIHVLKLRELENRAHISL
ncbi:MAG: Crp/Fnr family transcriptional regulator [Hyphomicrobium sp.]